MSKENLVSVITLTYRRFDKLFDTMNSVFNQNYDNIEYIISDDGSVNFPEEEIKEYANKYGKKSVSIIHHAHNVGTVCNLNHACRLAKGKYILFLSCGDLFYNENVVSLVVERFLQKKCNVIATTRVAYRDKKPEFYLPHIKARKKILKLTDCKKQYSAFITTHYWDMASGSAMYFTKEILEEYNFFDEKYYLWEDGPFLEKYLQNECLEFAYDIVSIWYELGGVSTAEKANPYLEKDRLLFDGTNRQSNYQNVSLYVQMWLRYIYKRKSCEKSMDLFLLRMKYPIIMVVQMIYKVKNRMYIEYDKKVLNQQVEEKVVDRVCN